MHHADGIEFAAAILRSCQCILRPMHSGNRRRAWRTFFPSLCNRVSNISKNLLANGSPMSLVLQPVQLEDFETIIKHKFFQGGDLVPPPMSPLCWPVQTPGEAGRRLEYSVHQQRQRLLYDTTTRFMKAVDTSTSPHEIISMSRWHYYPDGYHWRGQTWQDMDSVPAPNLANRETPETLSIDPRRLQHQPL